MRLNEIAEVCLPSPGDNGYSHSLEENDKAHEPRGFVGLFLCALLDLNQ